MSEVRAKRSWAAGAQLGAMPVAPPVPRASKLPPGWVEARVYMPADSRKFLMTMAEKRKVSFSTYCRRVLVSADHGAIIRREDPMWEGTS